MTEVRVPVTRVKFKDVFSLKNLYQMMHEMLLEEGWVGEEGIPPGDPSSAHRYIEDLYLENHYQKGLHAGGKELWIYWRLFKKPERRYSGYFRFKLNIDFHGVYIQDREIVHEGKKIKVQFGELELFFTPVVQTDYTGDWKEHWFLKNIQDIYEKRIISQDIEKLEKQLWREAYRLTNIIKKYLDMRVFTPTPEPLRPKLYGMSGQQ